MKTATKVHESVAPYGVISERIALVGERRVLLHGISWATYKALLTDLGIIHV